MDSEVSEVDLEFENESFEKAGVSLNDLKWLIENRRTETALYIAKKMKFMLSQMV